MPPSPEELSKLNAVLKRYNVKVKALTPTKRYEFNRRNKVKSYHAYRVEYSYFNSDNPRPDFLKALKAINHHALETDQGDLEFIYTDVRRKPRNAIQAMEDTAKEKEGQDHIEKAVPELIKDDIAEAEKKKKAVKKLGDAFAGNEDQLLKAFNLGRMFERLIQE